MAHYETQVRVRKHVTAHMKRKPSRRGFPKWLCDPVRVKADNPSGDFCSDWANDSRAPREGTQLGPIIAYLMRNHQVCREARIELCLLYIEFCKERKKKISRASALRMAAYAEVMHRDWDDAGEDSKLIVWEEGQELTDRLRAILAVPSVSHRREYGPIGQRTRFIILARDKFTCQYCGRSAPDVVLQVDHITPVSKGGTNLPSNLKTACRDCNLGKSNAVEVEVIHGARS